MAKIDYEYKKLLQHILDEGYRYEDPNRKGVYRRQISDYKIVHDFRDGFPALTTKKLAWKSVVGELLWILRGDTNIKYLVDNDINIWNKDTYNYYLSKGEGKFGIKPYDEFIKKIGVERNISNNKNYNFGDIGRGYGAQLRNWRGSSEVDNGPEFNTIDQFAELINILKTNPMATKKTVTFWNPAEKDQCALTPCHWSFEVLVEPIEFDYVADYTGLKENDWFEKACKNLEHKDVIKCENKYYQIFFGPEHDSCEEFIPKYQFTLKWHQHSVDTFLGR